MSENIKLNFRQIESYKPAAEPPKNASVVTINGCFLGYLIQETNQNHWILSIAADSNISLGIDDVADTYKINSLLLASYAESLSISQEVASRLIDLNKQSLDGTFAAVQDKIKKYLHSGISKDLFCQISFTEEGDEYLIFSGEEHIGYITNHHDVGAPHSIWCAELSEDLAAKTPDLSQASKDVISTLAQSITNIYIHNGSADDIMDAVRQEFKEYAIPSIISSTKKDSGVTHKHPRN